MEKLTWLIFLVALCVRTGYAQQASPVQPDSAADPTSDSITSPHPSGSPLFVAFTATPNEANRVTLKWDTDSAMDGDYFVIERSPDETHFETIGVLRVTAGTAHYETTDGAAPNGSDYYRIKYTAHNGSPVYSKTMLLSLSGSVDFKFYPNPVDKLFIVRTEHTIDLQVIDAAGSVRLSKRLQSGIQVVNVSTLEKGVYILRVTDKESNRAVSHQLVKN
ncbi:MAG TPA: T9SS type A sorting domain-containing protein [Mucilaginibacter sp.]|nr:T9SS type A sorting domain-containing protein [Mucilaginibacter sp.]